MNSITAPSLAAPSAERVITRCITRSMSAPGATVRAVPGELVPLSALVLSAWPGAGRARDAGLLRGLAARLMFKERRSRVYRQRGRGRVRYGVLPEALAASPLSNVWLSLKGRN